MIGLSTDDSEYKGLDDSVAIFTLTLIIDKFTDLGLPDNPREKLMYAKYLSDFEILGTIINTFDENEVDKLMKEANELIEYQSEKVAEILEEYESGSEDIEELSSLRLIKSELDSEESGE